MRKLGEDRYARVTPTRNRLARKDHGKRTQSARARRVERRDYLGIIGYFEENKSLMNLREREIRGKIPRNGKPKKFSPRSSRAYTVCKRERRLNPETKDEIVAREGKGKRTKV